jgi:hypothetical protein
MAPRTRPESISIRSRSSASRWWSISWWLIASYAMFGGFRLLDRRAGVAAPSTASETIGAIDNRPFDSNQMATIARMILLIVTVVACAVAGLDPDIGVFAFAFGAVLALIDPVSGRAAVSRIDWSTVMLVAGS